MDLQSTNSAACTNGSQALDEVWDMGIPDFTLSSTPEYNMANLDYQYPASDNACPDPGQFMFLNDGLYPWPFPELEQFHVNLGSF